ncbi:bacteriohopanetetrol glucosamine biosynthesis glycosyltransferase HpnI [Geobacter sp. SVR]|uniref:bacteriohopanetetrol glucosamine biosynthesis glycosyltransferase HpnI n=1 Tax=Geobacter sp. SVR TaxID=2495594 RepID=UPI00143F00D9|nr:bacteriohopanetetrol glucosamine biosynthesis glycosyltransferase HpnI [Geobacter sp. SVR]BCS55589.1 ceramide glucosyltransferase [Geobacter sp. SVR]GCF83592.1 ceramide glucosyltransferase [Geobacter sp. SVR]
MIRSLLPFIAILPALVYSVLSLFCARRFFKNQGSGTRNREPGTATAKTDSSLVPGPRSPIPGVTILKPVKGMDAESFENFSSFCRQDYHGELQLLFAVASADDPVVPVIRQLIEAFPGHSISLAVNPAIHGPNYKVSNLINAYPKACHDIIIVCDSDIRVAPDWLSRVTAHFDDPQVGLVTSLYRTSRVHGIATAIEATGFTTEMIPNVMVALQLEGLSFALGASMAVRRQALAGIGGFQALADYLADDYQLGNKLHRAGWRIALDDCFVESMMKTEDLPAVLARQLRWARTMRVSRPGGYLASGITLPFPAVLLAVFTAGSASTAVAAVGLLYAVRMAISLHFSRCLVRDCLLPHWLWLIPLRDMLSFCSWLLSFLGNRVEWRGNRFRLRPGGKLEELV